MTTLTTVRSGGQTITSIDNSELALGSNEFITAEYTNGTGSEITIPEGTVFGRITTGKKAAILSYDATDGSKNPLGVLYNGIAGSKVVAIGATVEITLITKGDIDGSKLAFASDTTVDSVVDGVILSDRLNQIGLNIQSINQLTKLDN